MEYENVKKNYFWEEDLFEGQKGEIEVTVLSNFDEGWKEHDVTCVTFDCSNKEDEALLPDNFIDCIKVGDKLMKKAGYRVH